MTALLHVALTNAAAAAVLALLAAAVTRVVRRPAVAHGLWLLVLLKLLMPPVVELGLLPAALAPAATGPAAATAAAVLPGAVAGPLPPPRAAVEPDAAAAATPRPEPRRPIPWGALGVGLWLLGAAVVAAVAVVRGWRFRRRAGTAEPAGAALRRRGEELAARLGLRRCPELRLTDDPIPPLVWSFLGAPTILLPRPLWRRLGAAERDAVLAHELAHVRRGDHRVRLVELAAATLFWWHPAAWWARRKLRRAEEQCCDLRVLSILPGAARPYADALLETLQLAAPKRRPLPAFASGIESYHTLEERLTMIFQHRPDSTVHLRHRLPVLALALLALAVFPTWSPAAAGEDGDAQVEAETQAEAEARIEAETRAEAEARIEAETQAEAERIEHELAHRELDDRRVALERALEAKRLAMEEQRRALEAKHRQLEERFRQEGPEIRAKLEAERRELEARYRELEKEQVRRQVEHELEALRVELPARLRALREHLRATGQELDLDDRLANLEAELDAILAEAARAEAAR